MLDDCGEHESRLLQGEGGSDAFARPDAKRKIGKSIDGRPRTAEKAQRIKFIGAIPQQAVAVQHVGRDDDERSRPDRLAVQVIATKRNAADGCDRRVQTNGFFDYRACLNQTIGETGGWSVKFAVRFGFDPLAPLA